MCCMLCFDSSVPSFLSSIVTATMVKLTEESRAICKESDKEFESEQNSKTTDLVYVDQFFACITHFPVFSLSSCTSSRCDHASMTMSIPIDVTCLKILPRCVSKYYKRLYCIQKRIKFFPHDVQLHFLHPHKN